MSSNFNPNSCRICFDASLTIASLTDIVDGHSLADMLKYCVNLEMDKNDGLPYQCCTKCKQDLIVAYHMVIRCHQSDVKFRALMLEAKVNERLPTANDLVPLVTEDDIKIELDVDDDKVIYAEPLQDLNPDKTSKTQETVHTENDKSDIGSDDDNIEDDSSNDESEDNNSQDDEKPLKDEKIKTPQRCCRCKIKLTSMEAIRKHSEEVHFSQRCTESKKISSKPFECDICFKRLTTKKALRRHKLSIFVENKFQCDECQLSFKLERTLMHHKDSHRNIVQPYVRPQGKLPRCCACFKQFDDDDLLRKHADKAHPASSISSENPKRPFPCDLCHRQYKNLIVLREHQAKPYRLKQFQCATCGRTFKEKCYLTDHERTHQEEQAFTCPVCSKSFAMKLSYRRHVKTHSPGEDRFRCEVCGKGFKARTLLKRHSITHNPQHRPIQCTLCPATFAWKTCLQSHMKMHTGEKPHKCNQCGAAYAFSTDLKRHIMAHSGIKPYVCTICGRGYPRQDYLRKHMASHGNQEQGTSK
ncbi:gastrula zinc finger protein XlCGF26.1-like [Aedes albopictus]|uniref:C2h2-type zn-finger protein n=1 Tax=Aedes albopictus TaxID=7160 RepID=A0ABM2A2Q1_AEDAL